MDTKLNNLDWFIISQYMAAPAVIGLANISQKIVFETEPSTPAAIVATVIAMLGVSGFDILAKRMFNIPTVHEKLKEKFSQKLTTKKPVDVFVALND